MRVVSAMLVLPHIGAEGRVLQDSLFSEEYFLDEIIIHPNGDIECDFPKKFEIAYNKFQNECSSKFFYEDFVKSKSANSQPLPITDYVISNTTYQKSHPKRYPKSYYKPQDENKIRNYVQKAVQGSINYLEIIKRILIEGGTREIHQVVGLFTESYELGHVAVKSVYHKLAEEINFLLFIEFSKEVTVQEASQINLHSNIQYKLPRIAFMLLLW